jgi:hypothetical protein
LKNGRVGGKGVRESDGRATHVKWTKVKCAHSGHTLRNLFEINLNINNEKQDCKIDTVCEGRC